MAQHVLYINGIQKCLKNKTDFNHKLPTECAFGKMFYSEIKPNLNNFSAQKQDKIKAIEEMHSAFHEVALGIKEHNPELENAKQAAWLYSTKLINLLNTLEKMP
jgi:hypothetical protein